MNTTKPPPLDLSDHHLQALKDREREEREEERRARARSQKFGGRGAEFGLWFSGKSKRKPHERQREEEADRPRRLGAL